jgi:hypothetical protein
MERTNSNHLLEVFSSEAYLTVNKKLLKYFGPEVAIYLSNLIDRHKYFKNRDALFDNSWFYTTHEQQTDQTGLSLTKLRSCKSVLKEKNVLRTKLQGSPPKEWYHLNFNILASLDIIGSDGLNVMESNGSSVMEPDGSDSGLYNNPSSYNNNIGLTSNVRPKSAPSKKERAKEFLPLAEDLSKIIRSTINIRHTNGQLQAWAYSICQLVEDHGVTAERIRKALKWYEGNIGGQYIPVIHSGSTLKEKFFKLEAAMGRENGFKDPTDRIEIANDYMNPTWKMK